MATTTNTNTKWLHFASGIALLAGFFLAWTRWKETIIHGYDMPAGRFFAVSESQFGLANPYPQMNFTFYAFWLIPVGVILSIILASTNKKNILIAGITGAMTLALVTVYYLFNGVLVDLGIGKSAISMMQWGGWLSALAAIIFIITALPPINWLKRFAWIIAGPLFAFAGFMIIQKTIWNQTYSDTKDVKPDYTIEAQALIHEFTTNDSAANQKYREKIVLVNGKTSQVDKKSDSTVNIQFADSTGSYIIFSFDKDQFSHVKDIQTGDEVSAKGSCSGSIRSEILGTTSISFKRSILNKNKK